MNKWITCAAVAALFLSLNIAHAVSCNPKAQVHQQRLINIQSAVSIGQIPSADDDQFVLCMLPEKEDQQAFKQRVQQIKNQQQARQLQEAEQRRQAITAHNRPQSPEEQARAQAHCADLVRESGELRIAGMAYCLAAWKANPHSMCGGGNLPCGSEINAPCYTPYAGQRCASGRVTGGGAFNVSPWFQNAPVQITKLADGIYAEVGKPCGNPGQPGVIVIQGTNVQFGSNYRSNTYRLVNTKQQGVLDAINNGGGTHGYNATLIVSGSAIRWNGYESTGSQPFRLCQASADSPVQQPSAPTATITVNGQASVADIDPLLPRTWAWSSTNGSTFSMVATISGCQTASQNGTVPYRPWQYGGSGTEASGTNTETPHFVKYGCTIVATYNVSNSAGQTATANATISFKRAPQ